MSAFFVALVLLATSPLFSERANSPGQGGSKKSPKAMVIAACGKPNLEVRRIGWGKFGPQFDVRQKEVEVLGGEPDVDYVRYLIKPKNREEYLELWFGIYAFTPKPDQELLENSVATRKRNIVAADGKRIGVDSSGNLRTGEVWRHTFIGIAGLEGAQYKASPWTALLFNQIIDSACYIPAPK